MRQILSLLMLMCFIVESSSQTTNDQISIVKNRKYFQNDQKLKNSELKEILLNNEASVNSYKLFQKNSRVASPVMLAGSALILAGAITNLSSTVDQVNALNDGKIEDSDTDGLGLAIAGLACVVISVPFALSAKKHLHQSINQYNSSLGSPVSRSPSPVKFNLMVKANRICVRMTF